MYSGMVLQKIYPYKGGTSENISIQRRYFRKYSHTKGVLQKIYPYKGGTSENIATQRGYFRKYIHTKDKQETCLLKFNNSILFQSALIEIQCNVSLAFRVFVLLSCKYRCNSFQWWCCCTWQIVHSSWRRPGLQSKAELMIWS